MTGPRPTLAAVAHFALPGPGHVRMHLGTDSGLTILDVEVDGAATTVHTESALAGMPGFVPRVTDDLRRAFGSRSVFALAGRAAGARRVSKDAEGRIALPLADGSWVAARPADFAEDSEQFRVTLLDAKLVPEAEIDYEDRSAEGVPRTVRLTDLRDGHRMGIELEETRVAGASGASAN
jgi:hypothetical protein